MNHFELTATLIGRDQLRFTPAGIPILNCTLSYIGTVQEAGSERQIEFELAAIAAGICGQQLGQTDLGVCMRSTGFLARKHRNSKMLVFHIVDYQVLPKE
ncbi:MAG: primosomal replication protein N [Ottowia sp.]|nr:primosomal replication protein N [Ottowia sp.]